jgi:restriction endonuclease S subunit
MAKQKLETIKLSVVADVLRLPPSLKDEKAKGGKKVQVLTQSALPLYGYVSGASQTYTLSKAAIEKNEKYLLKPNDVVFVATGDSIGKAHIVPEDLSGDMVATGTLFVIRFYENEKDNAMALAMYLNSGLSDKAISKVITGTTLHRINIKEIKNIKIPVLTSEVKKVSKQAWNNEIKNYQKMLEYRDKIEEARAGYLK